MESAEDIIKKINAKTIIDPITNCWIYTGYIGQDGYGKIYYRGRQMSTHRISVHIHHGLDLSNKNLKALHKLECPNKACWNPSHLYIGTAYENNQDKSISGKAISGNSFRTHCKYGHEFTEENTYVADGRKTCKQCLLDGNKIRRLG